MAERHEPVVHESVVEEQIRLAAERGAFENLPGKGRPLRLDGPDDDNWWVRRWIEREGLSGDALLPTSLLLRKEIQRLPGTVAALREEAEVRAVVSDLNRRIAGWLLAPTPPNVPLSPVRADDVVADWRRVRAGGGDGAADEVRHPVEDVAEGSGRVGGAVDTDPGAAPMTATSPTAPTDPTRLSGPARAFRAVAIAEACSWLGLLIGMFVKYVVVFDDIGVKIFGPIHGALFVAYLVVTVVAARRLEWSLRTTLLALFASIPPLFTLWFERWAMRTGRLAVRRSASAVAPA
ncbi:hypothetical protein GCM10023403_35360 [Pseudonocardia benzenivorans]|uniref:DnaJ-like, subfamily C, domain-containing protein n=2 Tax=Pseudonocardia TaxID=1847 RepID=F4D0V1_PSEUX|nr:DnaJ family domain-containing protein [Pseudonocardia dioxanivorans]AEA25803.1 DnaJ-like, subfamily C, domain-containing protein [Pseudonocardia dioxanivorans CB1190]